MRTLYISDLDGTLLDTSGKLPDESQHALTRAIQNGLFFTLATGRSLAVAKHFIQALRLKIPVVLSNGAFVFDPVSGQYLVKNFLSPDLALDILTCLVNCKLSPAVSLLENDDTESIRQIQVGQPLPSAGIHAIRVLEKKERLMPLYNKLSAEYNVTAYLMADPYQTGMHCLEFFSPIATKGNGALFVKHYVRAQNLISFGASDNDVSLFEVSDTAYAVAKSTYLSRQYATDLLTPDTSNVAERITALWG